MKKRRPLKFAIATALLISVGFAVNSCCYSLAYIRGAKVDRYQLWMHALKPFGGEVYYVGSEGDYSYFRAGAVFPERYKAPTANIHLPRTFPLGAQRPYVVTHEMVR